MPTSNDFQYSLLQATIFTPGLHFVQSKILAFLLQHYSDVFDGSPLSIPIPPDAPPEIPRIILESADKKYKLEVAHARVNLFRFRQEDDEQISINDFNSLAIPILSSYNKLVNSKVGRIAAIVNRFVKDSNPGLTLANHFCKDTWLENPLKRPESFEIHAHKRYLLHDSFRINSWIRCKTGIFSKGPDKQSIILVEQDINTLSEDVEKMEFSEEQIKQFFELVSIEFESILNLYFPTGE